MLKAIFIAPFEGDWTLPNYPTEVEVLGKRFRLASWYMPDGQIQYREVSSHASMHLRVNPSTHKWRIDHLDLVNPDSGDLLAPVQHFFLDTTVGRVSGTFLTLVAVVLTGRFLKERLS